MKNIYHKLEIHYSYLFFALACVLIGYYKHLIIFSSILFFHELGHIIVSLKLKFNIKKITIYSFGGIIKYEEYINRKINDDLLLSISGVISQNIFFLLILVLNKYSIITSETYQLFFQYNINITIFNLLPIIPLDGSKIFNLLLCKIIPYNRSNNISIIISLTTIFFLFLKIKLFDYNYITILIILLFNIYKFYNDKKYYFNKFILERYLYNYKYNRIKIIQKLTNMYKDRTHIIKNNHKYQTEEDFLKNMFDIK